MAGPMLFLLGGCSASKTLTGTWVNDGPVPAEFTLEPGGKFSSALKMKVPITIIGTWTYKQPHLTLNVTDVELPDDGSVPLIAQVVKQEALKKFEKVELAVSWKTEDQIVLSGDPPFMGSFRRKQP